VDRHLGADATDPAVAMQLVQTVLKPPFALSLIYNDGVAHALSP
jgi:hypothetical protein